MKILHTSDWHLGAKTDRRNRLDEQIRVMDEIATIADTEDVDVVLVAGDVYDNAVPTSDAEELFFNTIEKLSGDNNRVVIVLAGNHDDPKRLSANRHFAKKHNIVLAGDLRIDLDISASTGKNRIEEVGEGYVSIIKEIEDKTERIVVGILPYPVDYRINYKTEAESYSEKVKEWAKLVCKGFKRNAFNCLATHLTLVGSETEEDNVFRTIQISEAGVVKKSDLPKAEYYALGHIHSNQNIAPNMYYSGAPIRYSYIQKTCAVNIVTTKDNNLESIKKVDLKTPVKMEKVVVNGIEEVPTKLDYFSSEDIVELTIVQDKPLTSMQIKELKENYPCVLQVKLKLTNLDRDQNVYISNRDKLSAKDLFVNFYKSKKFVDPQNELTELFVELMEENNSETN